MCIVLEMYNALAAMSVFQSCHFLLIPPVSLFCRCSRGVVITMIISFVYILLMWCFAPVIVWTTIILAPILIAGSEWLCFLLQAVLFS